MIAGKFEVLRQEAEFVAINKPPGFHVHQPEYPRRRVPREITCLPVLREQLQAWLYPVHRIDVATEGVLVFALSKEAASGLCRQFQEGNVKKTYFALVRGWMPDEGVIDIPLELDSTNVPVDSVTRYRTHSRVELPFAIGKRHATSRYSLVEAFPETGRYHQVRRHMARLSHPLVGDTMHGDSHHNKYFRAELGLGGLWLKAKSIEFQNPISGKQVKIESPWNARWLNMFMRTGLRPTDLANSQLTEVQTS
jgi:tRNA pseudouridine65 synthase